MVRSRFLWKLFAGMVVLLSVVATVLAVLGLRALTLQQQELGRADLETRGRAAVVWLGTAADWPAAAELAPEVAGGLGVVLELFDPSGVQLIRAEPAGLTDAAEAQTGSARSLQIGGETGRVRIGVPRGNADRGSGLLLGGASVALLVAVGAAFVFARSITSPIRSVARAAGALGGGHHGSRIEVRSRDEIGALAGAFNDARDRMEEQLDTITRERNQLTAVLGSMAEGVIAVDEEERILHVNNVALEQLGLDQRPDGFHGRPILQLTRDPHVLQAFTETLESGRPFRSTASRGDGPDERVLELTSNVLRRRGREAEESIAGAVLVLHDVTRLQRLEGLRRDFVSNVSHELKTPLTAIRGFVETLLDTEDLDLPTRHRFLSRIREQTSRLSDLVADLLSLSRIESSSQRDSGAEPMDARVAVVETVQALRPFIERRLVRVELDIAEVPLLVRAEPESLRQAFSNLIDNAVKYSDDGARVRVTLKRVDDHGVFEVADEGPGIEKEHLERIFERFYRVDRGRSRGVGGTGLGLAIVKNVATALGGSVQVESERGVGSRFRMLLPLAEGGDPVDAGKQEPAKSTA